MNELQEQLNIKDMIYEIRNQQVMLDSDLARLYECHNGTKDINKAVKRNLERFPDDFYFQLTKEESENLRFQSGTTKVSNMIRTQPYVFTEQGVAMLSSVLKSEKASEVSVKIMRTFVEMRKFISENKNIFNRVINIENKLDNKILEYDNNFNQIFKIMEEKEIPKEQIFFEGEIYNAYSLIIDLISQAKNRIIIIDNYLDKTILDMLTYKNKLVDVIMVTKNNILKELDIIKFNQEYPFLKIINNNKYHDRFIIIDDALYHLGASIKDLGKKCFAINKIEDKYYLNKILKEIGEK